MPAASELAVLEPGPSPDPGDGADTVSFRAMGCPANVTAWGASLELVEGARARVDELERRWSRFLPDSEVSRLNRHSDADVLVSDETFTLVHRSVTAWHLTGGRFDPTCGRAMSALGYDRDLSLLTGSVATRGAARPLEGCAAVCCDPDLGAVRFPAGISFDPGGIGKGLAADIVAAELMEHGATGAVVDLGGDVAVRGIRPDAPWIIEIVHQLDAEGLERRRIPIALAEGGVATSSILRRRWDTADGAAHHIVDPATGDNPHRGDASVTVVAGAAWWAEAQATAALASPWCPSSAAVVTDHAGVSRELGRFHDYRWRTDDDG